MANTANIVIGPVRVAFPNIFTAKKNDQDQDVYGLTALIPQTPEGEKIKAQLVAIATEAVTKAWPDAATRPKFKSPIHDGNSGNDTDDGVAKGEKLEGFKDHWYCNISSRYAPGVLDKYKKPLVKGKDDDAIYGGVWLYLQVNAYTYDNKKKGVSFGLSNVMVARDDEKFGGGAPDPQEAFGAIPAASGEQKGNDLFG